MDELGPLNVEFLINNPELLSQAKQAEATLQGVNDNLQESAEKSAQAISSVFNRENNSIKTLGANTIGTLKIQVAQLQQLAELTPKNNVDKIAAFNKQIESLQSEITRLGNVGKAGFDEVGNAAGKSTNYFTKAYSWIRQIAYALPGIGVAGIVAFATEPIINYLSKLDIFRTKITQAKANLDALNEVQSNANSDGGKQLSDLKILYDAATDVNNSIKDRTAAARELQREFPSTFANSKILAILNGEESKSYRQLTQDVIENAKAKAAAAKIEQVSGQLLDVDFQRQKVLNVQAAETARAVQYYSKVLQAGDKTQGRAPIPAQRANQIASDPTQNGELIGINQNASDALRDLDQKKKLLTGTIDFLTAFAGGNDALAKGIVKDTTLSDLRKQNEELKRLQEAEKQLLDAQIAIQERVNEFKVKTEEKSLNPDQQALAQVYDHFVSINFQIEQANKKYDDFVKKWGQGAVTSFNANPANKIKLTKTDLLGSRDLNSAEDNQANINETKYIEEDIDKKKKLYADYEAYRLKVGDSIADKDHADLLLSGKDFQTYLSNILASIDNTDTSGATLKLKEKTQKELDLILESQKVTLEKLQQQYASYEQERQALIGAAQKKEQLLLAAHDADGAAEVKRDLQNKLDQLAESNLKQLDSYKALFANINTLTVTQAKQTVGNLITYYSGQFALGKISLQAYEAIVTELTGKLRQLNEIKFDNIASVGQALVAVGTSFEGINTGVASYIKGLGAIGEGIKKVHDEYAKVLQDQQDGINTFGDYASIAETGLTAVFSLIGSITSASEARKKAETDYYNSVIEFQNQYNIALDEQIRLQYQADGNVFLTNYSKEIADAAESYKKATQQYQQSLQDLQKGQAIVGKKNVIDGSKVIGGVENGAIAGAALGSVVPVIGTVAGAIGGAIIGGLAGLFGGKKKADVFAPLLQAYPDLIQANGKFNESLAKTLISTNQVSDATKKLLQNTINYYDEEQTSIDQITSALSSLASNLGTNLENALVQAFESGTSAAQAFGSSVSDVIGNIIQQFLFEDIFSSEFDKLNTKLKATVLGGGSTADITSDFVAFFKEAAPLAQDFTNGLKAAQEAGAAQGITLFPSTGASGQQSQSTLSGAVKGITETQANVLEGAIRGMQLAVVESNDLLADGNKTMQDQLGEMKNQTLIQMQIAVSTKRTADNTDDMKVSLKNIDKNTSDTAGNVLRAAGIV